MTEMNLMTLLLLREFMQKGVEGRSKVLKKKKEKKKKRKGKKKRLKPTKRDVGMTKQCKI